MNDTKRTLYLDMDGVVADWRTNARRVIGSDLTDPQQRYSPEDWDRLRSNGRIFRDLPLMTGAEDLVRQARGFRDDLGWELLFLTAIPHNNDVPWVFHDKIEWVGRYFPDIPVHFGPYSEDKWRHCRPGDILVDDRLDNCQQWRAAGGTAIRVDLTLASAIELLQSTYQGLLDEREQHARATRRLIVEIL